MVSEKRKPNLLTIGIIGATSPIPMLGVTVFWSWIVYFGLGFGLLGYSDIPDWIMYLGLLPLSFSPLFDMLGIVLGIVKIKEHHSILCIILSILGLAINFAMIFAMGYIGTRF